MGKKTLKQKLVTHVYWFSGNFKNFTHATTEYALLLNESYANGGNAIPFQMFRLEEELIGKMRF
jgi:hypothetical protein